MIELPLPPKPIPQETILETLISPEAEDVIPIDARPPSIPKEPTLSSTGDISSLLSHHREVQETLTEDLASMARQLKLNTLQFSASLENDKTLLEEADGNLGGNYDQMQKERNRLGAYSKKGGWTTCYVVMSVGAVAAAWMCEFQLDYLSRTEAEITTSHVLFDSPGEYSRASQTHKADKCCTDIVIICCQVIYLQVDSISFTRCFLFRR